LAFGLEQARVKPDDFMLAGWTEVVGSIGPKEHLAVFACVMEEVFLVEELDHLLERGWNTACADAHESAALGSGRQQSKRNGWGIAALSDFLALEEDWRMRVVRSIEPVLDDVAESTAVQSKAERVLEGIHRELAQFARMCRTRVM